MQRLFAASLNAHEQITHHNASCLHVLINVSRTWTITHDRYVSHSSLNPMTCNIDRNAMVMAVVLPHKRKLNPNAMLHGYCGNCVCHTHLTTICCLRVRLGPLPG